MKFEKLSNNKFTSFKSHEITNATVIRGGRVVTARRTNGTVQETAEERCAKVGGGVQWDGVRTHGSGKR